MREDGPYAGSASVPGEHSLERCAWRLHLDTFCDVGLFRFQAPELCC